MNHLPTVHSFNSEKSFNSFLHKINILVNEGILINKGSIYLPVPSWAIKYQYSETQENWILSYPDGAYRGFFKKESTI